MAQQMPNTVREIMEAMPGVFQPERAAGARATVQFHFSGSEPGSWLVNVAEGRCEVVEGKMENPTVTVNAPSEVWVKIVRRELDAATAFMSGQFTFTGDMGVLLQLPAWFGQV